MSRADQVAAAMTGLDRETRIRAIMREHVDHESWEPDLCDETPGAHKRYLLIEQNAGSASPEQPVWLSTHDTQQDAAAYWRGQENREDWNPVRLLDLDGDAVWACDTTVLFTPTRAGG